MGNCYICNTCTAEVAFEESVSLSNKSNELPPEFVNGSRNSISTYQTFLTDTNRLNFCTDENRGIQCSAILGPSQLEKIPTLRLG